MPRPHRDALSRAARKRRARAGCGAGTRLSVDCRSWRRNCAITARGAGASFRLIEPPKGLYLWGDVGRGKSMLMDLFFEGRRRRPKRRVHFNAFMVETHARIHDAAKARTRDDPIRAVAQTIARRSLVCCASTNSR